MLQALLAAGANPEARDEGGRTALQFAASRGHHEILQVLLRSEVDLEAVSARNVTALQMASERGHTEAVHVRAPRIEAVTAPCAAPNRTDRTDRAFRQYMGFVLTAFVHARRCLPARAHASMRKRMRGG